MGKGNELFIDFTFQKCLSVLAASDDVPKHFISVLSSEHVSGILPIVVGECMKSANISFQSLSAIYISKGPGSFTALRVLMSYVKGIHLATSVPIFTYNSTDWMAYYVIKNKKMTSGGFSIGFHSGFRNLYYVVEYKVQERVPLMVRGDVTEDRTQIDFLEDDLERELGAKYMFQVHLVKPPEKPDIRSLQPNYMFKEILQISQKTTKTAEELSVSFQQPDRNS